MWTKFSFLSFIGPWGYLYCMFVELNSITSHANDRSRFRVFMNIVFFTVGHWTRIALEGEHDYIKQHEFRFDLNPWTDNLNAKSFQVPLNVEGEVNVYEYIKPPQPCANGRVISFCRNSLWKKTELQSETVKICEKNKNLIFWFKFNYALLRFPMTRTIKTTEYATKYFLRILQVTYNMVKDWQRGQHGK